MQNRFPCGTRLYAVSDEAITLLGGGSIEMANQDSRIAIQRLEHGRISRVNRGDPTLQPPKSM